MRRRLANSVAFLLAFAMLFGTLSAATVNANFPPGICSAQSPALITVNEIPLLIVALIGISISLDVIAIGYIVGKLVPGTQLSSWVKKEYWEVAKSAILIAGVYAILILLGGIATNLVGISTPTSGTYLGAPFAALTTAAQSYLSDTFCGSAVTQSQTTVTWDWGDGGPQTIGDSASHTYAALPPSVLTKDYTITAKVTNSNGDSVKVSQVVTVSGATSPTSFSSPTSTGLGMGISFTGTETGLDVQTTSYTTQGSAGGRDYMSYLIGLSEATGFMGSLKVAYYIPIPTPGLAFTLGTNFVPYKNTLILNDISNAKSYESILNDIITLIILPTYTIIGMEYYLLPMFVFTGLAFLIPMGIIFRALPFLRGIGGTFFGIGVGIAVVLPAIMLLVNLPVTTLISPYLITPSQTATTQPIFGINPASVSPFGNGGQGFVDGILSFSTIYPALNGIVSMSAFIVVQFILFVLDLIITFPIIEAVAKSLGGTINVEFGRFKIK